MGEIIANGGKKRFKMMAEERTSLDYNEDRELRVPLVKNESRQDRANRILSLMEESNDRLGRLLEILDRVGR